MAEKPDLLAQAGALGDQLRTPVPRGLLEGRGPFRNVLLGFRSFISAPCEGRGLHHGCHHRHNNENNQRRHPFWFELRLWIGVHLVFLF